MMQINVQGGPSVGVYLQKMGKM